MKLFFSSLVVFSLFTSTLLAVNPKCEKACDRFMECSKEMNKGKSASKADIKKMTDGCLNTCKKKSKEVISCFESSQNSCNEFALCIQKNYSASKK